MAAPTFVGAGAGVTIASGSAACTAAGSGVAVGDLVILQVLQDGTAASAVTYSAISGIANLAGTASSLTTLATDQPCGSPTAAKQHLRVGRATSTTCSVTVATTGDDLYYRLYVFRDVNSGTALTDILENGTAGTISNGTPGLALSVLDTPVTTLGTDRLALNFVAVDDDNPLGPFVGSPTTILDGGIWAEAVAEFASATGTDGAIQLQLGYLPSIDITGTGTVVSFGTSASTEMRAQSFVPVSATTLKGVNLQLRRDGAPADNLVVEIRSDSGGSPSSTVLATASMLGADLTTTLATRNFAFNLGLSASTTYWIVLRRSGALDAANFYRSEQQSSGDYVGGVQKVFASGAWGVALTFDLVFSALTVADTLAGTIGGGFYTMAASDNWGVIGFALKPVPAVAGTNWEQPLADTLSLSDSATTQTGKSATVADSLAVADAASSAAVFARTITDPLSLTDSQAFQRDVVLPLADTLTLADLAATQRGIAQAVADTLALADLASTAAGKGVTLADTLALADAATTQAAFVRGLADTLTLADTIAAQSAFQLSIADTLALADTLSSQAVFARALADTLILADLADPVKGVGGVDHTQPIADTLALADALTAGSTLARAVADTLALVDSLTAQKAILRDLADTVSLADALRFSRDLGLTDTVALADTVSFQAAYLRTLADTVSLTDAVTAGRELTRALADTVALLDSLAATLGRAVTLDDALVLADAVDALLTAAVGEPPRASGLIDFPGIGIIIRPTRGVRVGNNRGNINTAGEGVLTKPTRGAT